MKLQNSIFVGIFQLMWENRLETKQKKHKAFVIWLDPKEFNRS